MNILILGAGGREHALAWKVKQSNQCTKLFVAPGNAGTAQVAENVAIEVNDFDAIAAFCLQNNIELLVVGPEDPLVNGVYDFMKAHPQLNKVVVIGPSASAAQLEGSKSFSKHFMQRHGIPTAAYAEFNEHNFQEGLEYLSTHTTPIVLKADGLAAGKGVVICQTTSEAQQVLTSMIQDRQFGEASARVVVEQFLDGIEVSVFVLTDGNNYKIIGHAKDYKRIGEGDTGLNTGGMGCVSPVPFVDEGFIKKVEERIIVPTIKGIQHENLVYKGFIFFGLIKVNNEPFVIEYNCRMGDPETEVVIPRLQNDLVGLFLAVESGTLNQQVIITDDRACCTVVAVSGGYPGSYKKHIEITGLSTATPNDTLLFHAGTALKNNSTVTNGGRVLAVTSFAGSIPSAVKKSLQALQQVHFEGMYYRNDIGYEFVNEN